LCYGEDLQCWCGAQDFILFLGAELYSTFRFAVGGSYASGVHLKVSAQAKTAVLLFIGFTGGLVTGVGGGLIRDMVVLRVLPVLLIDGTLLPAAVLGAGIGLQLSFAENGWYD
jgi:uncharacterized membrane protein YeiH